MSTFDEIVKGAEGADITGAGLPAEEREKRDERYHSLVRKDYGYRPDPLSIGRHPNADKPLETFGLTVHPIANQIPPMTKQDFQALLDDIRQNGQREPILVLKGAILDGRHRFFAIQWLNHDGQAIKPDSVEYTGPTDETSLWSLVLSRNLQRRHLTTGQRAILAARSLPSFKKPERKIAPGGGGSADLNDRARKASEATARVFGVSARTVEKAAKLIKLDKELAHSVERGNEKLDAALKRAQKTDARLPDPQLWHRAELAADALVEHLLELQGRGAKRITQGLALARQSAAFVRRMMPKVDTAKSKAKKEGPSGVGTRSRHRTAPAVRSPRNPVTWAYDARNEVPAKRSA